MWNRDLMFKYLKNAVVSYGFEPTTTVKLIEFVNELENSVTIQLGDLADAFMKLMDRPAIKKIIEEDTLFLIEIAVVISMLESELGLIKED